MIRNSNSTSQLRIIGGKWRSRKIRFSPLRGLRPTTDLMRETLFNWLHTEIVGASCLDLFAGSGALSFEALSRGAHRVVMSDAAPQVLATIRENAVALQVSEPALVCYLARIPERLSRVPAECFDIIFIDPPFHFGLVKLVCAKLEVSGYMDNHTLLYVECERELEISLALPASWVILKQSRGQLTKSYLCQRKIC